MANQYKGGLFKVPTFETASGWLVVAAGQDVSDEIRKASEDYFDAEQAVIDVSHTKVDLSFPDVKIVSYCWI
jgi:hypothetical protein